MGGAERRAYGSAFRSPDVAGRYELRPAYPDAVRAWLLELLPWEPRSVLDVGAGTGRLARALAPELERVDALEPSAEMQRVGRNLSGGEHPKLRWLLASLEEAALDGPYGLVVAGESFHWLEPTSALARFSALLAPGGLFAVVDGDGAHDPPWQAAEHELFLDLAEKRTGERPEFTPRDPARPIVDHPQFERLGARVARHGVDQSLDDYVELQHSRATLSLETLGPELARELQTRLRALLEPHATAGRLHYEVRTRVEWGRPLPR